MLEGFKIIDADAHVLEPIDAWREYLEPAFKRYALSPDLKIEGEDICSHLHAKLLDETGKQTRLNYPMSVSNQFDPESQIRVMQQMGVDRAFLYPTIGLWVLAIDTMPPQLAGAFARAYNSWLHDFCSYDPDRLNGVGAIALHTPEEMVTELQRIAAWGWKAVVLRPNPVKGRLLSDPSYEEFWSECERFNIAISIHEGTHSRLPSTGADRFRTRFALHACSHPMEQMMAMLALIEGGVLERHPKLRVAFLEAGCGWLPYWLWRMDEEYESLAWEVEANVRLKPSEYFYRQCFVSFEPGEPYLPEVINRIGAERLLFGSDYPHIDHQADMTRKTIALQNRLPQETVQKLLWDNPKCFYGLGGE